MTKANKIVVIGDLLGFPSLVAECFGTLSYLCGRGAEILVILVEGHRAYNGAAYSTGNETLSNTHAPAGERKTSSDLMTIPKKVSKLAGASVALIKSFDFHCPSQDNVRLLKEAIDSFQPGCVLMPYLGCRSPHQKILAHTSLITCRTVRNLLMYNPDATMSFHPTLISDLSVKNIETKAQCLKVIFSYYGWNNPTRGNYRKFRISNPIKASAVIASGGSMLLQDKERATNSTTGTGLETIKNQERFLVHRLVFFQDVT